MTDAALRDILPSDSLALLSVAQMGRADEAAIAAGTPGAALMAAAGTVVFEAIVNRFPPQPTLVLAGPGNNGGDAYIVAEKLRRAGWPVSVAALVPAAALKGDAAWAASKYSGESVLPTSGSSLDGHSLVVDGLFGAGLSRPLDGAALELVRGINARRLACVAIDIPSGIQGDSGQILGEAPACALTATFFRPKPGHLLLPGRALCGELVVGDIGIFSNVLKEIAPLVWRNGPALWRQALRPAGAADHKYSRGAVLVYAGSGMTGAARLASLAARRAGAGLVTVIAPDRDSAIALRAGDAGTIVQNASETGDFTAHIDDFRFKSMLLGPGGGVSPALQHSVLVALKTKQSVILDADALTSFSSEPETLFAAIAGPCLLTPHEGEFNRLFSSLKDIPNKVEKVQAAARLSGATILLKGADTVIASPCGTTIINDNAPPSLATAGSGDVLAGLAAGFLAQNLSPLAAGAAAAWLHGAAANRLGKQLIAEDLLRIDLAELTL